MTHLADVRLPTSLDALPFPAAFVDHRLRIVAVNSAVHDRWSCPGGEPGTLPGKPPALLSPRERRARFRRALSGRKREHPVMFVTVTTPPATLAMFTVALPCDRTDSLALAAPLLPVRAVQRGA
jgi:PAS domain-containing protein